MSFYIRKLATTFYFSLFLLVLNPLFKQMLTNSSWEDLKGQRERKKERVNKELLTTTKLLKLGSWTIQTRKEGALKYQLNCEGCFNFSFGDFFGWIYFFKGGFFFSFLCLYKLLFKLIPITNKAQWLLKHKFGEQTTCLMGCGPFNLGSKVQMHVLPNAHIYLYRSNGPYLPSILFVPLERQQIQTCSNTRPRKLFVLDLFSLTPFHYVW